MAHEQEIKIIPVLAVYSLAAVVLLIGRYFLLPPEPLPLPIYWLSWPLTKSFIDFINLFPILLFSAIASSFVFTIVKEQEHSRFSPHFFSSMAKPLVIIIGASAAYGILLLLIQPLLYDGKYQMQSQARLFKEARDKAAAEIAREDWKEAALHLAICERIWQQSEETQALRDTLAIAEDKEKAKMFKIEHPEIEKGYIETSEGIIPLLSGQKGPVTVREALNLAETNLARNNYFDAHWYATLAKKMTKPGTPEETEATLLATKAWNAIAEIKPTLKQEQEYRIYKEKLEGYNAILSGDWIRAYYIFNSLLRIAPSDPDVKKYFDNALAGTKNVAFFQDEATTAVGENLSFGVFSIPIKDEKGKQQGLAILTIDSLTMFSDVSYGTKVQLQIFQNNGSLSRSVQSAYAKFKSFTEQREQNSNSKTLLLLKAIDRNKQNRSWNPVWSGTSGIRDTYVMLDISYEDFLLASHAQTNSKNLSVAELFKVQQRLAQYGFTPQIFQRELINRITDPFLCLILGIVTLTMGWRLRPNKKPGLIAFPMFIILPLVSVILLEGSRIIGTIVNTALILSLTMPLAITICIINISILLFIAVLFLAGQRS
ncbi:LptF/LptG family permease [Gracilinema caldarium]|uniref:LptF/LptG family permease n=1 Tax=Gracilinema caldarium TaxID=215591 RepID=UPI0026F008A4|nr:LptF/LptG family permease [Gracilinema caldarium]